METLHFNINRLPLAQYLWYSSRSTPKDRINSQRSDQLPKIGSTPRDRINSQRSDQLPNDLGHPRQVLQLPSVVPHLVLRWYAWSSWQENLRKILPRLFFGLVDLVSFSWFEWKITPSLKQELPERNEEQVLEDFLGSALVVSLHRFLTECFVFWAYGHQLFETKRYVKLSKLSQLRDV